MPFVSICIPAYRNQKGLHRLLSSIRQQDYANYEVIVSDDTPDSCVWEVVASYANLPGFQYQRNDPRLGSPANWNRCLDLAVGDWIKIMHHDDWFTAPSSLRMFVELASDVAGSPLIFSACNAYRNGETLEFVHAPFGHDHDRCELTSLQASDLIFANQIGCPSVTMFRRDRGFRFDPALLWLVDVDCYVSIASQGGAWLISQPLINVTFAAETQITSYVEHDQTLCLKETVYLCNKHNLLQSPVQMRRLIELCQPLSMPALLRIWVDSRAWKPQPLPARWLVRLLQSRCRDRIRSLRKLLLEAIRTYRGALVRALKSLASAAGQVPRQR